MTHGQKRRETVSNALLNIVITGIVVALFVIGAVVIYNTALTSGNGDRGRQSQTYTRFNSCAIAQRSYKGSATISRAELEYCWDRAEADTGVKVTRYYGEQIN